MMGLVILFSSNSQAQYYYTSYGNAHDWYLPKYVQYSVYDHYYGYEIAHVERYNKKGHTNYNVLLHRNGWFVELRYDRHGHIYKTIHHKWHYPLAAHRCSNYCGYHHNYYKVSYPKYHKKHKHHGHKHHGHNHHKKYHHDKHHGKGHKHNSTYYTNVYIEMPQKEKGGKDHYHNQENRNHQRESARGNIRIPKDSKDSKANAGRASGYSNSTKVQRGNTSIRYTRPTTNSSASARSTTYRSGSRSSRQR